MRFTAALLLLASLLTLVAAPAHAAQRTDTLVVTVTGGDARLASEITARSRFWKESLPRALTPGADWDTARCGAFDIVARRLVVSGVTVHESSREVWVNVTFDDADLPSGDAALRAIGLRLEVACRSLVIAAHDALTLPALRAEEERERTQADALREVDARIAFLAPDGTDPARRLEELRVERNRLSREFTTAKIAAAVATSELDAARAALEKAQRLLALERDVATARAAALSSDAAARAKLADLEQALDAARAGCPPLDVARQRVFDLEITLVGAERRREEFAHELERLAKDEAPFLTVIPEWVALREQRLALAARLATTRAARDAVERARGVVTVTVVRPLGA